MNTVCGRAFCQQTIRSHPPEPYNALGGRRQLSELVFKQCSPFPPQLIPVINVNYTAQRQTSIRSSHSTAEGNRTAW
jgi:hypothetical protein